MEDLRKAVTGDWFDVRENMDNPDSLERILGITSGLLGKTRDRIRLSVEEGIIEFKRRQIIAVYNFIESFKYDSRGFDGLSVLCSNMTALLFTVLMQRLIFSGDIRRSQSSRSADRSTSEPKGSEDITKGPDIKEVTEFLQERIKKDQSFANLPEVKSILLQVRMFQKELATFNELKVKILPEKAKAFAENFRNTFNSITKKIQDNYFAILEKEEKEAKKDVSLGPLDRHNFNQLVPLITNQANEISQVRSTLLYAHKERYKTREILATISRNKDIIFSLYKQETDRYSNLEPLENGARRLSRAVGDEVIRILEREIEWISMNYK